MEKAIKFTTKKIVITAMFMAMNVALSSFGVPVPGGRIYLNDVAICFASLLLDPICAFFAGGVGALLGDLFFYPLSMFVWVVTHVLSFGGRSLPVWSARLLWFRATRSEKSTFTALSNTP